MAQPKTPRRHTPRTEHQVGNYRFVRLIGEGGMGQVYEVKHVELGRRAALKMLRPDVARNEETAARFFREARAMSLVQHPSLIQVYEYGHLDDGGAYLIMEYVEGESLRELLTKRGGTLPPLATVSLARQVAAALQAAHDKGVVHRDLKPENIMLTSTEDTSVESHIKILDFGVAKTLDTPAEMQSLQTRPGQVVGTPTYLAPEQATASDKIGGHTDVYALGVVLFEMLSGQPPFTGDTGLDVVRKHLFSAPPQLKDVVPHADEELDLLLSRMLSKAPETRPSMRDLRVQFRKISKRLEEQERPVAVDDEDTSQADTFILRPSRVPASVAKQVLSKRLTIFREKPSLLALGILLFGFLGLGIWLVLTGSTRQTPRLASSTTGQGGPERTLDRPVKEENTTSAVDKGKTTATPIVEPSEAPTGKIEVPRFEGAQRPSADDSARSEDRTVSKPSAPKPEDVVGILQRAQNALDKGNYRRAIDLASSVQKFSPTMAWRTIGNAACKSRNVAISDEAYKRLDAPGQQFITYICQRSGLERTSTGFRLAKVPRK